MGAERLEEPNRLSIRKRAAQLHFPEGRAGHTDQVYDNPSSMLSASAIEFRWLRTC